MKRTAIKRITLEARILRFMRTSRGMSMRKAGGLCGISDSAINHYEQGRMELSPERIEQLLGIYGYSMGDFKEYICGKDLPAPSIKSECISLLDCMDESKLRTVLAVLSSFANRDAK